MTTTLLIDGDPIVYQSAFSAQETFDFGDEELCVSVDFCRAKDLADKIIAGLMEELKADKVVICLSDPEVNWRHSVLPTYKANRDRASRPRLWQDMREYIESEYEPYIRPTLEADDVMGILATNPKLYPGKKIICTVDKDLATVPGWLYRQGRLMEVSKGQADFYHLFQTLTGDVTDGYKGCPGIGKVKALKILEPFCYETKHGDYFDLEGAWPAVVATYESKGLTEEDALVQARVARICRHSDYNYKAKEIILWTPK
jgi:DNA polymerase I